MKHDKNSCKDIQETFAIKCKSDLQQLPCIYTVDDSLSTTFCPPTS